MPARRRSSALCTPVSRFQLCIGDHIRRRIPGTPFWHHGLVVGYNVIRHYDMASNTIRDSSLLYFSDGERPLELVTHPYYTPLQPAEIVRRSSLRLRERRYALLFNNCEHFCLWARYPDEHRELPNQAAEGLGILGAFLTLAGFIGASPVCAVVGVVGMVASQH